MVPEKGINEALYNYLLPHALSFTPNGSSVDSVIDQWVQAIGTDSGLFGDFKGNERALFFNEIKSRLQSVGFYEDRESFFSEVFEGIELKPVFSPKFRFVDLFAGIGGMRLGFQNVGGVCVFSSEIDKHAQQTYKNNYGEFPFGDITLIDSNSIPSHDVLLAGFPCQPFSHAGLRLGIEDTRGTLFYSIADILSKKQPKIAVLENVKGLIGHDKGRTFQIILKTLIDLGYSCNIPKEIILHGTAKDIRAFAKAMVLVSSDFGVPQRRERIYIVLWKDGLLKEFQYPKPLGKPVCVGDVLEERPNPSLTISDRLWAGHQRRSAQNKAKGSGFDYGLVSESSPYTNTIVARYYKDGKEILIAQEGKNPRKLSPREAARLQGFPDSFLLDPSNSQAYKQIGNSVTVNVVESIAKNILIALGKPRAL